MGIKDCPNCMSEMKKTSRCEICGVMCCNLCSIEKLCIDCHVNLKHHLEIRLYKAIKGAGANSAHALKELEKKPTFVIL